MPAADLSLLLEAAQGAAAIAKRFWRGSFRTWDKGDGAGPVTEADLQIDAHVSQFLQNARPEYGWMSEETEDHQSRLARDWCFVVDPLDGTRSFINGDTQWAHSLAVVHKGVVQTAVVFVPLLDQMFHATRNGGAFLNDQKITVSSAQTLDRAKILAARPLMEPEHWKGGVVPNFQKKFRPSLAYRMGLVAQGRYDGMITLRRTWEWDIAAGTLLVQEAGGTVTNRMGQTISFNSVERSSDGIIAAPNGVHQDARQLLA